MFQYYSRIGYELQKSEGNAGYDLPTATDINILPNCRVKIPTGIYLSMPNGYYANIEPRSGLAANNGIVVLAGIIDPNYRGEIHVCLLNTGKDPVVFTSGSRVCQMVIKKYESPEFQRVEGPDKLTATERGDKGFGDSGV